MRSRDSGTGRRHCHAHEGPDRQSQQPWFRRTSIHVNCHSFRDVFGCWSCHRSSYARYTPAALINTDMHAARRLGQQPAGERRGDESLSSSAALRALSARKEICKGSRPSAPSLLSFVGLSLLLLLSSPHRSRRGQRCLLSISPCHQSDTRPALQPAAGA